MLLLFWCQFDFLTHFHRFPTVKKGPKQLHVELIEHKAISTWRFDHINNDGFVFIIHLIGFVFIINLIGPKKLFQYKKKKTPSSSHIPHTIIKHTFYCDVFLTVAAIMQHYDSCQNCRWICNLMSRFFLGKWNTTAIVFSSNHCIPGKIRMIYRQNRKPRISVEDSDVFHYFLLFWFYHSVILDSLCHITPYQRSHHTN